MKMKNQIKKKINIALMHIIKKLITYKDLEFKRKYLINNKKNKI